MNTRAYLDILAAYKLLQPPTVIVWVLRGYPEENKELVTLMDLQPSTAELYRQHGINPSSKVVIVHPDNAEGLFTALRERGLPYTTERPWLFKEEAQA
jgi:hypothetical protein